METLMIMMIFVVIGVLFHVLVNTTLTLIIMMITMITGGFIDDKLN